MLSDEMLADRILREIRQPLKSWSIVINSIFHSISPGRPISRGGRHYTRSFILVYYKLYQFDAPKGSVPDPPDAVNTAISNLRKKKKVPLEF